MTINQNLVPVSKYPLKCPNAMTPIGLCVHNTANDASAKGEISYMVTNTSQTSFHLAVDDIEVWQGLPLDRNGWHAGDGANGEGNRKYIGIEICYSKSGGERFTKAEENASQLIADLLRERNWGIERVKKHQDFSGKYCPHRTLDLGWDRFLNLVKTKMGVSMANMYKGYDLANPESMKVAVDVLVRLQSGELVEKKDYISKAEHDVMIAQLNTDKENLEQKNVELQVALTACENQPPVVDAGEWRENGKSVTTTVDNTVTTINYERVI